MSETSGAACAESEDLGGRNFFQWQLRSFLREDHGCNIYGGDIITCEDETYLATVGKNRLSVYLLPSNGDMELIQAWVDEDTEEVYYSCAFTWDRKTGDTWVATAGKRGIIKVINVTGSEITWLTGHGNEVNQVAWHPQKDYMLLSASKDESVRLWNAKTGILVAIFAGIGGHRYDVLAIAFHDSCNLFASGGMDNSIKLWAIGSEDLLSAIEDSYVYDAVAARRPFKTRIIHQPLYSTISIHGDYVDFVHFFGDAIISKCAGDCTHKLMLWCPNTSTSADGVLPLIEYRVKHCESWFVKAGIHPSQLLVALGSREGKVHLYPICDAAKLKSAAQDITDVLHPMHWLDIPDLQACVTRLVDDVSLPAGDGSPSDAGSTIPDVNEFASAALARANGGPRSKPEHIIAVDEEIEAQLATLERDPSTLLVSSKVVLETSQCKALVRQVLFTPDGTSLLVLCDDSSVWRWQLKGTSKEVGRDEAS